MIINHNMNALNAHRNMGINNSAAGKSMEKLSSGLRINRAGDDAAGLAISEKMRGQIRGLTQASRNASDGISMIQTAEGALNETTNILQRMRELAVQASNDTNTASDRNEIQKEIDALTEEVDRIANNTEFNTQKLLNGNKSGVGGKVINEAVEAKAGVFNIELGAEPAKNDEITIDGKTVKFEAADITNSGDIQNKLNKEFSDYEFRVDTNKKNITITQKTPSDKENILVKFKDKAIEVKVKQVGISAKEEEVSEGKAKVQVGANSNQSMSIEIDDMRAKALNITDGAGHSLNVLSAEDANKAITAFDAALNEVSSQRANLGAVQNRLEYTISSYTFKIIIIKRF